MSILLDNREVTARATHDCELCGSKIEPATNYRRQKVAGDGTVWTFKACLKCYDLLDVVTAWSIDHEGIGQQTYLEWAHDVRSGLEPVEPCVHSEALAFLGRCDDASERRRRANGPEAVTR